MVRISWVKASLYEKLNLANIEKIEGSVVEKRQDVYVGVIVSVHIFVYV